MEREQMLDDAVAEARQNDHTGGLRERVLRGVAAKWPPTICDTAPGRGKFGKALTMILDADDATLRDLAARLEG